MTPDIDDVIVQKKTDGPGHLFVVGSFAAPKQFLVSSRDEAISQAVAIAKQLQVRAWCANGDDNFVLLGSFRRLEHKAVRAS